MGYTDSLALLVRLRALLLLLHAPPPLHHHCCGCCGRLLLCIMVLQTRAALMSRLASSAGITQPSTAPAAAPAAAPYAVPGVNPAAAAAAAAMGTILPGGLLAPGVMLPGITTLPGGVPGLPAAVVGGAADLALQQGVLGPASPIPTPCLLLKGMFTAATQSEPEWDLELAQDVQDECTKFGHVLHLHVDKDSQVGWGRAII